MDIRERNGSRPLDPVTQSLSSLCAAIHSATPYTVRLPVRRQQKYTLELLKRWLVSIRRYKYRRRKQTVRMAPATGEAEGTVHGGHSASSPEIANECIKYNHGFRLSRLLHRRMYCSVLRRDQPTKMSFDIGGVHT